MHALVMCYCVCMLYTCIPFAIELPYGDQGLFMWKKMYEKTGGYKNYRLFEDYELVSQAHVIYFNTKTIIIY